MRYFHYTDEQTELLALRDRKLGDFIAKTGHIDRLVSDDFFSGLCYNIVNQQLSMKACDTLWNKLTSALGLITPETCHDADKLRSCGLSQSKANCIASCAEKFISAEIVPTEIPKMSDNEVSTLLTSIKGIGRWTAEMTLIFCLERPDVLSLSDYGIRKGLSVLHDIDIKDIKAMQWYRELYSPYGTIASFYLWEAAKALK